MPNSPMAAYRDHLLRIITVLYLITLLYSAIIGSAILGRVATLLFAVVFVGFGILDRKAGP